MSFAPENIVYHVRKGYRKAFYVLTNQSYISLAVDVFIFKTCLEIMKAKLIRIYNRSGLANGLVFESFLT